MATTTNFGWETPDDSDLVKDGALAIRTLGSAIDATVAGVAPAPLKDGYFYPAPLVSYSGTEIGVSLNTQVLLVPWHAPSDVTLTSVSVNVVDTNSPTAYIGLYNNDLATMLPTTLFASLGSFSGSTTGIKTISTSQVVPAGIYWIAIKFNSGSFGVARGTFNFGALLQTNSTLSSLMAGTAQQSMIATQSASGTLESSVGTITSTLNTYAPVIVLGA